MSPGERDALEAKADRAVRRGELGAALAVYQQLSTQFPGDPTLTEKLARLRENLQPMELSSPKARFAPEAPGGAGAALDEAEALAARGDHAGAIALYRKALLDKPESELLKERLAELFRLAQAPRPSPPGPPPSEEAVLGDLLSRISARRKP